MKRLMIAVALPLLPLLFCGLATQRAAAIALIPQGRWTVYHISDVGGNTWSAEYTLPPWPIEFRFKCSQGAVVVNASNTSKLQQNVPVKAWDLETDETTLDSAIASGRAELNRGFALPAGQSVTFQLYRPALCSASSNSFVFGAVYGG